MPSSNLLTTIKPYFGIQQIEMGERLFRQGAVNIHGAFGKWVTAITRDNGINPVSIDAKKNSFVVDCSCDGFKQNGVCRHIWATFLLVDQKGLFQSFNSNGFRVEPKIKELVYDYDDTGFDEDERIWEEAQEDKKNRLSPDKKQSKMLPFPKKDKQPSWPELLNSLVSKPRHVAVGGRILTGEIFYSIILGNSATDSAMTIEIGHALKDQNGAWKKPKLFAIKPEEFLMLESECDRSILLSLFGTQAFSRDYSYNSYPQRAAATVRVPIATLKDIVPRMLESGRFHLKTSQGVYIGPLLPDVQGAWQLRLSLEESSAENYILEASLMRGSERQSFSQAILFLADAFVFWNNKTVSRLIDNGCFGFIPYLSSGEQLTIKKADAKNFLGAFFNLPSVPPLALPQDMEPVHEEQLPQPAIKISASQHFGPLNKLSCFPRFIYGNLEVPAYPFSQSIYKKDLNTLVTRSGKAELEILNKLPEFGIYPSPSDVYYYGEAPDPNRFVMLKKKLPEIVRSLVDAGWLVEADGALYRKGGGVSASVEKSGTDWFDLQIACNFDGAKAELPAILAALKKGEDFVRLGDGSFGMLPEEWLKKIAPFARMGKEDGGKLRFHKSQALIIDLLLFDQPEANCDATFQRVRDELRNFSGVTAKNPPQTFCGVLRPYQSEGLGWLHFLKHFGFGGCLADDMGLGKTIQVLALFAELYPDLGEQSTSKKKNKKNENSNRKPSLIVVPRSLIFNWMQEAKRFVPHLRLLDHSHALRTKEVGAFDGYDIVLITYGTLRRDIKELRTIAFEYVILDEAQTIKNPGTIAAKATRLLTANNRLALSGTPVENHLGELWSIFEFLNPGMLGSASVFAEAQKSFVVRDAAAIESLRRALRPFLLRRTKSQVASDLPPRQEETLVCEMEAKQRKLYDELRDHYRESLLKKVKKDGINKSKIHVLEALLRLRQVACHPGLVDPSLAREPSAKLETLFAQIDEILEGNHKAIIFSQFTSLLAILRGRLDAQSISYEYLDGQTNNRQERVEHFQNDAKCPLFLISLKAGGVGLNLTAAEYVFLLDPWWNPAVEAQAIDRTHRIGQTKPVFAYRLICKDTVEEKILEMQKTKRQLADSIISADNSVLSSLSADDLAMLLS